MESRDRKKNDCSWFWVALDRPLTDAQRNALRTLFAPAGKAGGKQEDVRLLAYALRGYVLYRQYGLAPGRLQWRTTARGRPYLAARPEIDSSLSHSGGMAACAVGRPFVGVDIQKIKRAISLPLAQRVCTHAEMRWLWQKEAAQRAEAFVGLWALKESYLKWSGEGLSRSMRSFSAYEKLPGKVETSLQGVSFSLCTPLPGYRAALCTQGPCLPDIKPISQAQVLQFYAERSRNQAKST